MAASHTARLAAAAYLRQPRKTAPRDHETKNANSVFPGHAQAILLRPVLLAQPGP